MAVPASWNDQFPGWRDFLGPAEYRTTFEVPWGWDNSSIALRFDSVQMTAVVRCNDIEVGGHHGGHLPFECDVTSALRPGPNELVVEVDGRLDRQTVPPGQVDNWGTTHRPNVGFDFFPYCGIHRHVWLVARPHDGIDVAHLDPSSDGSLVATVHSRLGAGCVRVTVASTTSTASLVEGVAIVELRCEGASPWSPDSPNLHQVVVELIDTGGAVVDTYPVDIGFRSARIDGDALLLNGEPITLRGLGRHEDFAVAGRGWVPAVAVNDLELLRWCGANSFRTSHYPYAEETLELCDRLGILVLSESPAVGLLWGDGHEEVRRERWMGQLHELVERDRNHPSVIAWSIANEPVSAWGDEAAADFAAAYQLVHELDPSRPATHASAMYLLDETSALGDFVSLNRYQGWYVSPGDLDAATEELHNDLEVAHERFGQPVLLSEFGADTMPGLHSVEGGMWTEEFQVEFVSRYLDVAESLDYVIGAHPWNLADFATGQSHTRVGSMNWKGVFTRDRRPKAAAHMLRDRWGAKE